MRRPDPGLSALAEVRQRGVDERVQALAEAKAEVRVLAARHEELRSVADASAAERQRLGDVERRRLEQGVARVADLGRAADFFAAADTRLAERRREADRSMRALDAGLREVERARVELSLRHAEQKAAQNLLERRALGEQRRGERAAEAAAEDALRARAQNEREGTA